jgi:hypothetical protein
MNHFQDDQKTKAAGLPPLTASGKTLNPNNTSACNQRAITLLAITNSPKSTIELRHDFGIMHPAARIQELRDMGHQIHTVRINEMTPDGIKHKAVAKYELRGVHHE